MGELGKELVFELGNDLQVVVLGKELVVDIHMQEEARRRRRQSSIVRDRRVGHNFWIINFLTTGVGHISCSRRRSSCSDHSSCWSPVFATAIENTTSNTYNDNNWQT